MIDAAFGADPGAGSWMAGVGMDRGKGRDGSPRDSRGSRGKGRDGRLWDSRGRGKGQGATSRAEAGGNRATVSRPRSSLGVVQN